MFVKNRWKLNLVWGVLLVLLAGCYAFILKVSINDDNFFSKIIAEFLVMGIGSLGLFLCIFLIMFVFTKTKYPVALTNWQEYSSNWLKTITSWNWLWMYVVPTLIAIIIPASYFIFAATNEFSDILNSITRIIQFVIICIFMSINNIIYLLVISRINIKENQDF